MGCDLRAGLDLHHAAASSVAEKCRGIGEAWIPGRACLRRIDAAQELFVRDFRRRGDQCADIHLRSAAEDNAVLIDDVNRTVSLDVAEDLAWLAVVVEHAIEGDPVAIALLVETQIGLLADI